MSPRLTPATRRRLTDYTLLAAATLAAAPAAEAGIVYTDVDPDATVIGGFYNIDFNGDGTTDLTMRHYGYSYGYGTFSFTSRYARAQMAPGNAVRQDIFGYGPAALNYGEAIGSGAGVFATYGFMGSFFRFASATPYYTFSFSSSYGPWAGLGGDRYLGVRFNIGGNTHYGWVRLEVPAGFTGVVVKDFAYEDIPNTTILAGDMTPAADKALALVASDIADNGDGADLELAFTKADDESTVSEYRLIARKAGTTLSATEAEALPPSRYVSVTPSGSDVIQVFGAGALDADGDPIVPAQPYVCVVLSMPDGVNALAASLSDSSNVVELLANASPGSALSAVDINNTGTAADLFVSFNAAPFEATVGEYRVIIVDSASAPSFNLTAANAVSSGNYTAVAPTGSAQSVLLSGATRKWNGAPVANDEPYVLFLLSVADGVVAQSNVLSPSTAAITLRVTSGLDPASGEGAPRAWYDGAGIALDANGSGTWRLHGIDGRLLDEGTYAPGTARLAWPSPERALILSGVQDGRPWTRRVAR